MLLSEKLNGVPTMKLNRELAQIKEKCFTTFNEV